MSPTKPSNEELTEAGAERCHLLELPPELRNNIYTLALTSSEPIKVTCTRTAGNVTNLSEYEPGVATFYTMMPSLLEVCKMTRLEAMLLFFANNTFHFDISSCYDDDDLTFLSLGAKFKHIKRFEFETTDVTFTVDLGGGLGLRKVSFNHQIGLDVNDSDDGDCYMCCCGREALESVVDDAVVGMGKDAKLGVEEISRMMQRLQSLVV